MGPDDEDFREYNLSMPMTWRLYLAAGLAALMAAPGPAFAGQIMAVVPQAASRTVAVGTFGLGGAQAAPGFSRDTSLGSLPGTLQVTTLLMSPAPVVKPSGPAAVAAVAPLAPELSPLLPVAEVLPTAVVPTLAAPDVLPQAAAKMDEARSVLAAGAGTGGAKVAPDPTAAKGTWDAFWSRSRPAPAGSVLVTDAGAPRPAPLAAPQAVLPAKAAAVPSPWRKFAMPLTLAAVWGAARFALPSRLPGVWAQAAPYLAGGGVFLATYAANSLAHRAVGTLARRLHWKSGTVMAARLGTSVTVYAVGGALALHTMGVSSAALLATFGIGGVAMTMAAKDFIGNFLEGVKMLLTHPFIIGDRITIGAQEYTLRDMDLRYLSLVRPDGAVTMMTYSQLAEKTVTIFREYSQRALPGAGTGLRSLWTAASRLVGQAHRQSLVRASLWTVLGLGLAVALPFAPALMPVHALTTWAWLPYAKGAVTLLATHSLEKGVVGFIRRLADDRGWRPQAAVVLKLGVQLGLYLAGGTMALHFFGMTWPALLKSLGATSIAVGWASGDLIGNLIQGFWILTSHPFTIGDELEVGTVSGKVADMNLSYVVLQHPDKSHTLVPYAALKASPFTVLSWASGPVQ